MKKALRIGFHRYDTDEHFEEHLRFIQKNAAHIDEITLFAEFSHYGYWDLETSAQNAALLKHRIADYRAAGIPRVGINLLTTIGHLDEGWGVLPPAPFPYQVHADGSPSKGQLCFANEAFLEHTARRYTLYAKTGADFIWMDDDIRVEGYGCLCDGCIRSFNEEQHAAWDRASLVKALPENAALCDAWMRRQNDAIQRVIATVRKSVQAVDPRIAIGYMSINGNKKPNWIEESRAVMGRPGGGFYDERSPWSILEKGFRVQQQIAAYPARITDIQYEYEAFNYQTLNRSRRFTELETALALMSGCTGVLYNNDIFRDSQTLLDMLAEHTAGWSALTERNRGALPTGVYCCDCRSAKTLAELGLPVTAHLSAAVAAFATGKELARCSDAELRALLDTGLFTDGAGLELLCDRGYAERCGGTIAKVHESGMAERFTDHAVNGKYPRFYRDAFMNFSYYIDNTGPAYTLAPAKDAAIISNLETITHQPMGCSCYLYEGADGTCFAADGYLFPKSLNSQEKREQITNLIDRIAHGRLPVRTDAPVKLMTSVTLGGDGGMQILLANLSLDDSGSFTCRIRNHVTCCRITPSGALLPMPQAYADGETLVPVDHLRPFEYLLLTCTPV